MRDSRRFVRFVGALIAATGLVTVGAVAAWTVAMAQHQHAPSMEGMQKPDWLVKLAPAARTEAIQHFVRKGWLVDSGQRRWSQRTGRYEVVWESTVFGKTLQ